MQTAYTSGMKTKILGMLILLFTPILIFMALYNMGSILNLVVLGVMTALVIFLVSKGVEVVYNGKNFDNSTSTIAKLTTALCLILAIYYVVARDVSMLCSLFILGTIPMILSICSKNSLEY